MILLLLLLPVLLVLLLTLLLVNVRLLMLLVLLLLRLLWMPPLQQLVGLSLDMLRPTLPIRFVLRRMALMVRFLPFLPKFGMTSVPRSVG